MLKLRNIGIVCICVAVVAIAIYFMFGAVSTKESSKSGTFVKCDESRYSAFI